MLDGDGVVTPLRIGVLAYPGCFGSEVFGVPDLLTIAAHVAAAAGRRRPPPYETVVVSPRREVCLSGGAAVVAHPMAPVDVLVVPGFPLTPATDLDTTLDRLRREVTSIRRHGRAGGAVVSVCVGAFLVAEAGLLDGRSATTSWLFAERLALRYPTASIEPGRLVVTDRGVTTTAAFSAMHDVALDMIRGHHGATVARRTARVALVDDTRTTQTPYVDPDLLPPRGGRFAGTVQRLLTQDLAAAYDLRALAAAMHVSPRTLLRRFHAETGAPPLAHLQDARIRRARALLETTDDTVAAVAARVGYRDAGYFSALFARHTGRRPGGYRASLRREDG